MSKIVIGKTGARNVALNLDLLLRTARMIECPAPGMAKCASWMFLE